MSFQAMTWAVSQDCKGSAAKLVLLMLANHANGHTGQCTPSHKLLADECNMSVASLKVQIKKLSDLGLVTIIPRVKDGVNLPNQYVVNMRGGSESGWGVGQNLATESILRKPEEEEYVDEPKNGSPQGGGRLAEAKASRSHEDTAMPPAKQPDCQFAKMVELYHEALPGHPRVEVDNPTRRKHAKARWMDAARRLKEKGEPVTLEALIGYFRRYFTYAARSQFLTGQVAGSRGPFFADFDFLISPKGFAGIIEGKYHRENS